MFYKQCSGGARSNKSFQSTRHQPIICLPYQLARKSIYSLSTHLTFIQSKADRTRTHF